MNNTNLLVQAAEAVILAQRGTVAHIAHTLCIWDMRASRLLNELVRYGVVGPKTSGTTRKVLVKPANMMEALAKIQAGEMVDPVAAEMARSSAWMDDAECLTVAPEFMQPEMATRREVEQAKAVCGPCPVKAQCLLHAQAQGDGAYGVHAGQWFGPDPGWLDVTCKSCGKGFERPARMGSYPQYCSPLCRKRGPQDLPA